MTRHGRQRGKNVAGGRGWPGDVAFSVPLVVLRRIKGLDARQREASGAEHVVARVCIGRHHEAQAQMREHSNSARASAAVGTAGVDAVHPLVLQEAHRCGGIDAGGLSADTTAQALPMGSPNAPGMLRGLAQRGGRALTPLAQRGGGGRDRAQAPGHTLWRSGTDHPRFPSGKAAKREGLTRIVTAGGAWIVPTRPLVERLATRAERVIQRARARLLARHEGSKPLLGQIGQWRATGQVAANNMGPGGLPHARAIVRNNAGKTTEFGVASLIRRLVLLC